MLGGVFLVSQSNVRRAEGNATAGIPLPRLPQLLLAGGHYMPRAGLDAAALTANYLREGTHQAGFRMVDATGLHDPFAESHGIPRSELFCVLRSGSSTADTALAFRPCSGRADLLLARPQTTGSVNAFWDGLIELQQQGLAVSLGLDCLGQEANCADWLSSLVLAGRRPAVVLASSSESLRAASEDRDVAFMTRLTGDNQVNHMQRLLQLGGSVLLVGPPPTRYLPSAQDKTDNTQHSGIFGRPSHDLTPRQHMRRLRELGEGYRFKRFPVVRWSHGEADPVLLGSTRPGGDYVSELRVAPALNLVGPGMLPAGPLEAQRAPIHRHGDVCPTPNGLEERGARGAFRAAWARYAACMTAGIFVSLSAPDFEPSYAADIAAITAEVDHRARKLAAGGTVAQRATGTEKVVELLAWPKTFEGALSASSPLAHSLLGIARRYLQPYLDKHVFGAPSWLKAFSVSRNMPVHNETIRMRGNTWHWDTLPNGLVKVLLYLSDVTDQDGCMLVMLHNRTGLPFKMVGDKLWGYLASPASVPKEWLHEMMMLGYRPHCASGPAGSMSLFDTNIVHRASRPGAGRYRDSVNFEFMVSGAVGSGHTTAARRAAIAPIAPRAAETVPMPPQRSTQILALQRLVIGVQGTQKPLPAVGFGSANRKTAKGQPLITSLLHFFRAGGRHVDTAAMYRNHRDIRTAVERAEVPQDEVWLTSKVNTNRALTRLGGFVDSAAGALEAVKNSTDELGARTIDLMLVHTPAETSEERVAVWRGLIEAQRAGLVRVIGVSNFNEAHIDELSAQTGVGPAVLSLEYHPWVSAASHHLVRWCLSRRIAVVGYNSLGGRKNRARGSVVSSIAQRLRVGNAQVLLRWALQRGVRVIPGATSYEHIIQNLNLTGFELSPDEMQELQASRRPLRFGSYQWDKAMATNVL